MPIHEIKSSLNLKVCDYVSRSLRFYFIEFFKTIYINKLPCKKIRVQVKTSVDRETRVKSQVRVESELSSFKINFNN